MAFNFNKLATKDVSTVENPRPYDRTTLVDEPQ